MVVLLSLGLVLQSATMPVATVRATTTTAARAKPPASASFCAIVGCTERQARQFAQLLQFRASMAADRGPIPRQTQWGSMSRRERRKARRWLRRNPQKELRRDPWAARAYGRPSD